MRLTTDAPSSSGGYSTVEDEGTPVTQQSTINFTGAGVTATDSGGKTVVTIPGGAGSGASGVTEVDFGAFPGNSDSSVAVTGQASIVAGSVVNAWIVATATSDHSADEHFIETIRVTAGNIIAGTGFTIYAFNTSQANEPLLVNRSGRISIAGAATTPSSLQGIQIGGKGTRLYGKWTVHWEWE